MGWDSIVLLGDFNAQVGIDIVGRSLPDLNPRGLLFLDLHANPSLSIMTMTMSTGTGRLGTRVRVHLHSWKELQLTVVLTPEP